MRGKWTSVLLLIGFAVGVAAAQVYPPRWEEGSAEPPRRLAAVDGGVVALGQGGLGLHPDSKTLATIQSGTTAGIKVDDGSCGSANRGEVRLFELSGTGGSIDAFCFCARKDLDMQSENYWWSCFKVPV